jgi:hypothetical protein
MGVRIILGRVLAGPSLEQNRKSSAKELPMKRQNSMRINSSIKFVAVPLMSAGMFLSSLSAVAENPIPFKAMMQSAGAQAPVPPKPTGQQVNQGPITSTGKAEIGAGFLLVGAGIVTITATALLNSSNFNPAGPKTPLLYGVGAGATAAGVTLVALGFHKHKAR